MSSVILLSSSPPRIFARSPTIADSSSPLPTPGAILRGSSGGSAGFKTTSAGRDGFSTGFSTARQLLGTRVGAENVPIRSPGKQIFKQQWPQQVDALVRVTEHGVSSNQEGLALMGTSCSLQEKAGDSAKAAAVPIGSRTESLEEPNSVIVIESKQEDPDRQKHLLTTTSSLFIDKAIARKTDWTPPRLGPSLTGNDEPTAAQLSFPSGLLGSFGYQCALPDLEEDLENNDSRAKRRRLDEVDTATSSPPEVTALVPKLVRHASAKVPAKKRVKSPVKKPKTITGLATANYLGLDAEATPIMQYLTATQAATVELQSESPILEGPAKRKRPAKVKAKQGKKVPPKSRLLSPASALQAFDSQEAMFGSASQLARDESPTLIRDTLEALRQSESNLFSDPISTQQTMPISIESTTPRTGTSRFTRRRNLWAAAGRDEDNAMLHFEAVDLTDSPALRKAFAGKDVLLQPDLPRQYSRSKSPEKGAYRSGLSPTHGPFDASCYDIDDITTPAPRIVNRSMQAGQVRALHTSARDSAPREVEMAGMETGDRSQPTTGSSNAAGPSKKKAPKRSPTKPAYAGFSTHDLQKQISAYGFKAVKKREKMIELLDRCWEEKHGAGEAAVEAEVEEAIMKHGDFLSTVHDISTRPVPKVPKVKKPRAVAKKDKAATPAKTPRKRKKAEAEPKTNDPGNETAKKPGKETAKKAVKRKSKPSALSEEFVLDVDEIDGEASEEKGKSRWAIEETREEASLSAQLPSIPVSISAPSATATSNNSLTPDLHNQITLAITNTSNTNPNLDTTSPPRNHQTEPTFHEKILLYDPIILEDLTGWLNAAGFRGIGEDREVSALQVRAWCEAQGVCCLWRGGWRGAKGKAVEID